MIEKEDKLGGTCLHVGCIPTKALLFNAEVYDHLKAAEEYGIDGLGAGKLNWKNIQDRKNKIVTKHTKGLDFLSTYPWVKSTVANWFRGDFANITLVIDLTLSRIDSSLFTGTRWEGDLTTLELQWGRTIGQVPSPYTAGNPLVVPYHLNQGP